MTSADRNDLMPAPELEWVSSDLRPDASLMGAEDTEGKSSADAEDLKKLEKWRWHRSGAEFPPANFN